jgi:hypothetical protein
MSIPPQRRAVVDDDNLLMVRGRDRVMAVQLGMDALVPSISSR